LTSSIILPFVVPQYLEGTKEYKSVNQFTEQKGVIVFFLQAFVMNFHLSMEFERKIIIYDLCLITDINTHNFQQIIL